MIQKYIEQISDLEQKIQKDESQENAVLEESSVAEAEKQDTKETILHDPTLTSAHKKTMVMLYSQYTTPRKVLKKQLEQETESQDIVTEKKDEDVNVEVEKKDVSAEE